MYRLNLESGRYISRVGRARGFLSLILIQLVILPIATTAVGYHETTGPLNPNKRSDAAAQGQQPSRQHLFV